MQRFCNEILLISPWRIGNILHVSVGGGLVNFMISAVLHRGDSVPTVSPCVRSVLLSCLVLLPTVSDLFLKVLQRVSKLLKPSSKLHQISQNSVVKPLLNWILSWRISPGTSASNQQLSSPGIIPPQRQICAIYAICLIGCILLCL